MSTTSSAVTASLTSWPIAVSISTAPEPPRPDSGFWILRMAARTSVNRRASLRIATRLVPRAGRGRTPWPARALGRGSAACGRGRPSRSRAPWRARQAAATAGRSGDESKSQPCSRPRTMSCFSSMTATISSIGTPAWSRSDGEYSASASCRFGEDADVVDDQAAGLVAEGAVDPRDGLHQPSALHRSCRRTSCASTGRRSRSATCRAR